jgi:putative ABC transport system permease protein
VLAAFALTRTLAALLFETQPTDPATMATVAVIIFLAALLACWVPARRSTRVDPVIALRAE